MTTNIREFCKDFIKMADNYQDPFSYNMLKRYLSIHNTKELVKGEAEKYLKKCRGEKLIEVKGTLNEAINSEEDCLQITLYDSDLYTKDKAFFDRLKKTFNDKVIRKDLQTENIRNIFGNDPYLFGSQTVGFLKRLFMRNYIKMLFDKESEDIVIPKTFSCKAFVPANYICKSNFEMLITNSSLEEHEIKSIKKDNKDINSLSSEQKELLNKIDITDGLKVGDNVISNHDNKYSKEYNLYVISEENYKALKPFIKNTSFDLFLFNIPLVFLEITSKGNLITIPNGFIAKNNNKYFLLTKDLIKSDIIGKLQFIATDHFLDILDISNYS